MLEQAFAGRVGGCVRDGLSRAFSLSLSSAKSREMCGDRRGSLVGERCSCRGSVGRVLCESAGRERARGLRGRRERGRRRRRRRRRHHAAATLLRVRHAQHSPLAPQSGRKTVADRQALCDGGTTKSDKSRVWKTRGRESSDGPAATTLPPRRSRPPPALAKITCTRARRAIRQTGQGHRRIALLRF